ncbi:MAG: hypothetical protein GY941_16070 [Planctomycetes bacterium]|nr:hypothetical protein [Planctomycetota bacterium]
MSGTVCGGGEGWQWLGGWESGGGVMESDWGVVWGVVGERGRVGVVGWWSQ